MGQRTFTSTARRRLIGHGLAGLVVVAACSSGSTDESGGNDTTPPTNPPATTAPAGEAETAESTAPVTPTTEDSVPAAATADPPPTLSELEEMAFDGEIPEIDVALTEFSVVTGVDIDGALPVTIDEFVPDELTSVVMRLEVLDDQLSDEQRRQIEEYLDEIRSSARVVADNTTVDGPDESAGAPVSNGDDSALGAEPSGDARISAFAGLRDRPTVLTDEQLIGLVAGAQEYVMGRLGGIVPDWQFSLVAPEDRVGEELSWNGWAHSREVAGARSCEVFIVNFPTSSIERIRATVDHEFFHCWHSANVPGPFDDFRRSPRWVVEGLAEWVESEGSGAADGGAWAQRFLNAQIGKLYTDSYAAVGFYWQINHLDGGPGALWGRIPNIIADADAASAFRAATAGLTPRQLAQLASSSTRLDDLGAQWVFDNPRLGDGARPIQGRAVRATSFEFATPGQQVAIELAFAPDDAEPRLIELAFEGLTNSIWNDELDSTITTSTTTTWWCLNPECVCEDGRQPVAGLRPVPGNLPLIIVALTGGASEPASVKTRMTTLDEACEEEVADPELTGVWVADPAAVVAAYDQAYQQIGISVTGASGELSLTLFPDLTAELRYQDLRLGLSDPFVDEVIINGAGRLDWRVQDGQLVFSKLVDFSVSVVTPAISNDPLTFTSDDLPPLEGPAPDTTMDYIREGSSLSMSNIAGSFATLPDGSPGVLVFPLAWVRAGDAPDS